jgi:methionine biosynthesis protein MetW
MSSVQQAPRERTDTSRSPRYRLNRGRYGTHMTLVRLVPHGSAVLDVGCASGYLGALLAQHGCRVWGLDADAEAVAAVPACYEDVRVVDLEQAVELPWSQRSFDVVVVADVLEHLRDPRRVLRTLGRYVVPGGHVIVSLPNVAHVSVRLPLLFGRFAYRETGILDESHCHLYTFATARELVESSGLRVDSVRGTSDHFGAALGPASPVRRFLRGLLAYNIVLTAVPIGLDALPSTAFDS